LDLKLNISLKGSPNGVAELGSDGRVPSSQLPSFVDDVLEFANFSSFPATGETGKIYIAIDTNITYRWSGTIYVEISSSLALGETSATAYRGDRGKTAYDHSQISTGNPHGTTKTDIGLGNVDNTTDLNKPISTATQTALNLKQNIVRRTKVFTNQATNFQISQADIDNFEAFEFDQTTAGIVISLNAPTGNVKKDINFKSIGTATINLIDTGTPIATGKMSIASYNGASWNIFAGGGGSVASGKKVTTTITQNAHGFTAGKLLALKSGVYVLADNTDTLKMPCVAVVDSVVDSNTFVAGGTGYYDNLFTGLTADFPHFVGTNGAVTATAPIINRQVVLDAETATKAWFNPKDVVNAGGFAQSPYRVGQRNYYTGEYADFTDAFGRWLLEDGRAFSRTTYSELYAKYTIQFTGNITNGSNVITNVADTTKIAVGRNIEGIGIPAGAIVSSITTNTITLSANATASTTAVSLRYFIFGNGDGSTTYNIADTRGRVWGSIGQGTGLTNRKAGDRVGADTGTLTASQLPPTQITAYEWRADLSVSTSGAHLVYSRNNVANNGNQSIVPGGAFGSGQPFSLYQPTAFDGSSFVFAGTN